MENVQRHLHGNGDASNIPYQFKDKRCAIRP
jgi:hypothetical protein